MELVIYRGGTVDLWVNDRNRAQQTVSVKGQTANMLGFTGLTISAAILNSTVVV